MGLQWDVYFLVSQGATKHHYFDILKSSVRKGVEARDATSESEEEEVERVEWGTRQYGVRMSPAHPWYVGRGDDVCEGRWCTPYKRSGNSSALNLTT